MPRINRIRISNVPYSGRYIVDQLIDCYKGENVLLNLANGGGKSVLTQLIMQPIIPNIKIHKRKVEAYLTSKEPTFVMIEWLLDNTTVPTYFLTGIVMNRAVTEENSYRVKYFTFVNQYKEANLYDIKNIDFITKENDVTKYKSYDYCLAELRKKENNQSQIETFTIDEQKRYSQVLEERGIFKEEWKVLARINEKEGGIDDLFENCEKSDDVVNQWILKTISEKLDNADDLREMFLNLMMDVMNHEDEIKQKEELEQFKKEADKYIQELTKLLENMDKEESIKEELEEIFLKLGTYINKLKQTEKELNEKIDEKNKSLEMIDYEEQSEEYYKIESDLEVKKEQLEERRNEISSIDAKRLDATNNLRTLKATKIYEEYKEANAEKEAAFAAKEKLEDGEKKEKIRNIEYSLKEEYRKQINSLQKRIDEEKQNLEKVNEEYRANKAREEENKRKNMEMQNSKAVNCDRIDKFKKYQEKTLEELNIELIRNILEELDKKDIQNIISKYDETTKNKEQEVVENEKNIKNNEEKIIENRKNLQEIENDIEQAIYKQRDKKQEIKTYEDKTKELKKILENFSIDAQRLFDVETNLVEIERKRDFVNNRKNENTEKLNQNKQLLYSLKNGGVHVDLQIGKILKQNKIDYETGEEYLTGQSYEYQKKLLQTNPMLPYSYIILREQDYEKVDELIKEEEINRLTPIILQKHIEKDFSPKNKIINVIDNVKLECLYNIKAFDEKLKSQFEQELLNQIDELNEKIKNDENKMVDIQNAIRFIKDYEYKKDDEKILNAELRELEEEVDNLKMKKHEVEQENNQLNKANEEINKKIYDIKKLIENNRDNKNKFMEFLNEDKKYMDLLSEQKELNNRLKENEQEQNELDKIINEKEEQMINLKKDIEQKTKYLQEIKIKNGKIPNTEEGEKLENTLEELEEMYEETSSNILRSEESIREKIEKATKTIISKGRELDRDYQDLKGRYEEKIYSEEEEDIAKEKEEKLINELKILNDEKGEMEICITRLETRLENVKSNLKKLDKSEPLQAYLIKGKYDIRKKELKEEIQNINVTLKDIKDKIENTRKKRMSLLSTIEEPEYKEMDITNFDYNNLNTKELIKKLVEKKEENNEGKRIIDNLYNTIERENSSKNQVICKFLENMNPYKSENEFANYYHTYERVIECANTMEQMLKVLQNAIANIENDKNNIKHHAYLQGKNIYLEMKQISDNSGIKMPGKLRKVSLLEIELPKELDQFAEERINDYIEECINKLREECSEVENIRQTVGKRIKDWLSDRQLLNKVINTESIEVKLYKIDISDKNSGLKRWEEVIVDNSGGEKLISCLILVLALMQYTRKKVMAQYGEDEKNETSKFLIIDNPFGKMSSTHLLNGLMLILDKFNVQAICLSDISQSSITNQFKVIYQLSLKSGKYTDKIYLTVDNIIKSPELIQNYILEQAYVRTDMQTKLW